ncbi:MAG: SDR family oxidoreductase [Acidimicrobiia bacterium]
MGKLDGRVAIITGAGRGIGREHALYFASEGAKVVVNDLGGAGDGSGSDIGPAQEVVNEIKALGGEAVANTDDVADWEGGQRLINTAIEAFGDLNVLVNNAGILRDRMITNMTEQEWDVVVRVVMKGHFVPTRWAAAYWREQSKAGKAVNASVINTSSTSGLFGNAGQSNYGAAKSGLGSFTVIVNNELQRYGVRVNAIAPAARTRLTDTVPAERRRIREDQAQAEWDPRDPANITPFVAYLATAGCPINGRVFWVSGGEVGLFEPWSIVDMIKKDGRWTLDELEQQAAHFADFPLELNKPY